MTQNLSVSPTFFKMEHLERLNELIGKDNIDQLHDFLRKRSIQRDLALAIATLGTVLKVS